MPRFSHSGPQNASIGAGSYDLASSTPVGASAVDWAGLDSGVFGEIGIRVKL